MLDIKPGGGGIQVQRGAAPALRISRKKGSFLRLPHVRDFVKEGYFFVPRYEVCGGGPISHYGIDISLIMDEIPDLSHIAFIPFLFCFSQLSA